MRNIIRGFLILFCILFFSFELYSGFLLLRAPSGPPLKLGNRKEVISYLKEGKGTFSFAVVGDTKGFGVFEKISGRLREMPLSFLVLLGDCVFEGNPEEHRFLWTEINRASFPFPVFYVVGEHDLGEGFDLRRFEETYGPANFYFLHRGCLFIGLNASHITPDMEGTRAFLRQVLSAHRQGVTRVFVFMHAPPLPSFPKGRRDPALVTLFEKYRVDYVFAGHYHAYARKEVRGIVYLVSGGGGARLNPPKYGKVCGAFHHAIIITVSPEGVSEDILFVERGWGIGKKIRYAAMVGLPRWVKDHKFLFPFFNLAAALLVLVLLRRSKVRGKDMGTTG